MRIFSKLIDKYIMPILTEAAVAAKKEDEKFKSKVAKKVKKEAYNSKLCNDKKELITQLIKDINNLNVEDTIEKEKVSDKKLYENIKDKIDAAFNRNFNMSKESGRDEGETGRKLETALNKFTKLYLELQRIDEQHATQEIKFLDNNCTIPFFKYYLYYASLYFVDKIFKSTSLSKYTNQPDLTRKKEALVIGALQKCNKDIRDLNAIKKDGEEYEESTNRILLNVVMGSVITLLQSNTTTSNKKSYTYRIHFSFLRPAVAKIGSYTGSLGKKFGEFLKSLECSAKRYNIKNENSSIPVINSNLAN